MIALTNPPFIGTDNLSMSPVDTYTDVPFKWRVTKRVSRDRPANHDHVESPVKKTTILIFIATRVSCRCFKISFAISIIFAVLYCHYCC